MGAKGEYSVLELDGTRLTAITATMHSSRVEVRRWLSAFRPETVPADNPKAIGEWVGSEFERAGLPKGKVVLAISRGDIVLKQLSLPANAELTEADLSNMVRLQMSRQLTMGLDGAAIDYAVVGEELTGGSKSTAVLAGAMPAERVAWCRQVVSAAGLKLSRIGLRSFGAASLLAELSQRRAGPVLGIAVGASSTEFVVVHDGRMLFARAADVPRPTQRDEIDSFAERLSVEAKRTWMSFRSGRSIAEVEVAAVIGEGDLAKRVAERCAAGLSCSPDTVTVPPGVTLPDHMPEGERAIAAPLAGLLLEQVINRPTLDFANPRRAPDRYLRQRQIALVATLGVIVFGGFGFVTAKRTLRDLESKRADLQSAEASLRKKADEALAMEARATHLAMWKESRPDWLRHFAEAALPAGRCVLDDFTGSLRSDVSFVPKKGASFPSGEWVPANVISLKLAGTQRGGDGVGSYRETLLERGIYDVVSSGPDMPERFALDLSSNKLAPKYEPPKPADPKPEGDKPAPKPKKGDAK